LGVCLVAPTCQNISTVPTPHGERRAAQYDTQAQRLNQPLIAFETPKHSGSLGQSCTPLRASDSRLRLLALKIAERGDEVVVRLVELDGKPAENVRNRFAAQSPRLRRRRARGASHIASGEIVTSLTAFSPARFALKLGAVSAKALAAQSLKGPTGASGSTVNG
jgi:alpha-mannosidase